MGLVRNIVLGSVIGAGGLAIPNPAYAQVQKDKVYSSLRESALPIKSQEWGNTSQQKNIQHKNALGPQTYIVKDKNKQTQIYVDNKNLTSKYHSLPKSNSISSPTDSQKKYQPYYSSTKSSKDKK